MSRKLFGTDGIRGRANEHPMTPEIAMQLGMAIARIFKGDGRQPKVVIGKDTRISNYMFETAIQAGLCSMGVDAVQLGVLPTPAIAFMTTGMRAHAGVVISASHNSYEDNGIKFFAADGFKLPDRVEAEIEALVTAGDFDAHRAGGADVGKAYRIEDAVGRYCVYLKGSFPRRLTLAGLKVVVDCAHGAAYRVAPEVLYELGADVVSIGTEPNGRNINDGVGAVYPEQLARRVTEESADLGIALDGDADRCILVDADGGVVDGDAILAMLAKSMMAEGRLARSTVAATVMSNLGLERALSRFGAKLIRTAVGDRHVVERMRADGLNLGGEQSGHLVLLDHGTTGDGMLSALQVLAMMVQTGRPLSELASIMERAPQVLKGVMVTAKPAIDSLPTVREAIASAEAQLGERGRVLVRYSGTEPKCRVMLEGDDADEIARLAEDICGEVQQVIGAR